MARLRDLTATLVAHLDLRADGSPSPCRVARWVDDTSRATWQLSARRTARAVVDGRSTFISGPIRSLCADGRRESVEWPQGLRRAHQSPSAVEIRRASRRPGHGLYAHRAGDLIICPSGLYLLSRRMREVLLQVTTFTVAHSITLGLSLYGFVPTAGDGRTADRRQWPTSVSRILYPRLHPRESSSSSCSPAARDGVCRRLSGLRLSAAGLAARWCRSTSGWRPSTADRSRRSGARGATCVAVAARPVACIAPAAMVAPDRFRTIERVIRHLTHLRLRWAPIVAHSLVMSPVRSGQPSTDPASLMTSPVVANGARGIARHGLLLRARCPTGRRTRCSGDELSRRDGHAPERTPARRRSHPILFARDPGISKNAASSCGVRRQDLPICDEQ